MGSKSILILGAFTFLMNYNLDVSTTDALSLLSRTTDFEKKMDEKLAKLQQTLDYNTNSTLRTLATVEIVKSRLKKLEAHFTEPSETEITENVTQLLQTLPSKVYTNENLPAKLTDGTIKSRRDKNSKPWVQQIGGCGGILVGEKGIVNYVGEQFTQQFRCIWTIRANTKNKVNIKLLSDNLGDNWITVAEYTHIYLSNNATDVSTDLNNFKIEKGDRKTYTLNGPVVFLHYFQAALNSTTDSNALSSSSFNLHFEGVGEDTHETQKWNYTHYHFTKPEGSVKYPEKARTYDIHEIVTFVWNPLPIRFIANLTNHDLEDDSSCNYDSLTVFYYTTNFWVQHFGPKNKKFRFCGEDLTNTRIGNVIRLDSLISIFKSDVSTTKAGFRFAWGNN